MSLRLMALSARTRFRIPRRCGILPVANVHGIELAQSHADLPCPIRGRQGAFPILCIAIFDQRFLLSNH